MDILWRLFTLFNYSLIADFGCFPVESSCLSGSATGMFYMKIHLAVVLILSLVSVSEISNNKPAVKISQFGSTMELP